MKTSKSPNAVAIIAYATAKHSLPAYRHEFNPKKFTQHQLVACLVLKEFFTTDYRGIKEILKDSSDLRKILGLHEVPRFTTLQKAVHRLTKKKVLDKLTQEILSIAVKAKVLIPSLINHFTSQLKFRLQNFVSREPYLDKVRVPTRFSREISAEINVKALMRDGIKKKSKHAGIDGTGFESHHISSYFVKRKAKYKKEYQMTTYTRYPKAGIIADSSTRLILSGVLGRGPDLTSNISKEQSLR